MKQNDERTIQRRSLTLETRSGMSDNPAVTRPALAA